MDTFNAFLIALLASSAVGMGVSFIIQLGKLWAPKWFPDSSADNWRLGLIVVTAAGVFIARLAGLTVELEMVEQVATSLAALGATLMPLLVLIASWIAKQTYLNVFKGIKWFGKSYTPVK